MTSTEQLARTAAAPNENWGVAFLCHPYHRGGVTRWMVDAAAELRRRGTPVWFVAPEPRAPFVSGAGRPTMAALVRALAPAERPVLLAPRVGVSFELGTHAYRTTIYAKAIRRGVPSGTPVIVSDDAAVWKAAAAVGDSHPMIAVLHSDEPKYYSLARAFRKRIAVCVAVSKRIAMTVSSELGIEARTIPCGVPMRSPPDDTSAPGAVARLVWVGRVDETQKRVSDLPLIGEQLRARGVRFNFLIVGDGPDRKQLAQAIEEGGLGEEMSVVGWKDVDAIWSLLCASDVLVLPSNFEGMPVAVMEALSAGCSVVASRVSGVEDIDSAAYPNRVLATYPTGDVESAALLIARALEVPRSARKKTARQMAAELFSIGACVDRYQQTFLTVGRRPSNAAARAPNIFVAGALSFPIAMARASRRLLLGRAAS